MLQYLKLEQPPTRTLFPQTIKDWNSLEQPVRELITLDAFKEYHNKNLGYSNNHLYHHNSSRAAMNHTRIRLGLSGLSSQKHDYNHINNPKCLRCNAKCEDPRHFFLTCHSHDEPRTVFLTEVHQIFHSNDIEVDFRSHPFRRFLINMILKGTLLLSNPINQ